MYNEYRQSSVSYQCWIWSHRWRQNIWGYFTVCSSDSAVFQAATTFSFSCVTDSMLQTPASLPRVWMLWSHCAWHSWVSTMSVNLAWEPLWCVSLQAFKTTHKSWIYTILSDGTYQRLVHHHFYEIHLNLMGRILLKHWLIFPTQLLKGNGSSFADRPFSPALRSKQFMHVARLWLGIGHFSCPLISWHNLTCSSRFSHSLGCPSHNTLRCSWFSCNWSDSSFW